MSISIKAKDYVNNAPLKKIKGKNIKLRLGEKASMLFQVHCLAFPTKEWSAVHVYSSKGSILEDNLELDVHDMYLMDVGSAAYTEYDLIADKSFKQFYKTSGAFKNRWRTGHIHSHQAMSVYFSGTDNQELKDSAPSYNTGYLSIIVNNRNEITANIAFSAKRKMSGVKFSDTNGNFFSSQEDYEEDVIISYEIEDITYFKLDYLERIKELTPKPIKTAASSSGWNNWREHVPSVGSPFTEKQFDWNSPNFKKQTELPFKEFTLDDSDKEKFLVDWIMSAKNSGFTLEESLEEIKTSGALRSSEYLDVIAEEFEEFYFRLGFGNHDYEEFKNKISNFINRKVKDKQTKKFLLYAIEQAN